MCLAVYVSSSLPLPAIEWRKEKPSFYLQPTSDSDGVRNQFGMPFVYYAGSHEGCGCGFSKDGKVGEDLGSSQENYSSLAGVIRSALSLGAAIQVFTCWEGEQSFSPLASSTRTPEELEAAEFELQPLEMVTVLGAA